MDRNEASFKFWRETLKSAKYILAPMVDQSELAWRLLARRYGTQLCYTPMFHAAVFSRDPHYRKEALQSCEEDRPLIVQFCANDPQIFLKAAKLAEPHCEAIDLNLGCPQSVAKRGHYGAFLQDEWDLVYDMVSLCAKELEVPITCKIRVFEDIDKTVRYAQMLERAGCQLLTVHGRTLVQKGVNTGIASWAHITAVRQNVKIPVFANGNIQTLSDVHRCLKETSVQGVMSAEGHLHDPALFAGQNLPVWQLAEEYLDLAEQYPCSMSYIRGHLFKMFHHVMQVNKELRDVLGCCRSLQEAKEFTERIKQRCQPDVMKYEADKNSLESDLPLPYWICQPYTRPSPGEPVEHKSEKEACLKRSLENVLNGDTPQLSKNQLKKLRRYPNKSFEAKKAGEKFKICPCGMPRGLKCVFEFCKACCRQQANLKNTGCPGHRYKVRDKGAGPVTATSEKTGVPNGASSANIKSSFGDTTDSKKRTEHDFPDGAENEAATTRDEDSKQSGADAGGDSVSLEDKKPNSVNEMSKSSREPPAVT